MAARLQYQIVGRYMDRTEVVAYHLQCLSNGKSVKLSKEQVAFLVGRGQVTNCQGQIYQDKLLLRGVGVSLDSLPTKQVNREGSAIKNTSSIGKVRNGTSAGDAMSQVMIVQFIVDGKRTIGAVLQNSGGGTAKVDRNKLIELASAGRIGNARVQKSNDRVILRGVNCDLRNMPTVSAKELGLASQNSEKPEKPEKPEKSEKPEKPDPTSQLHKEMCEYIQYELKHTQFRDELTFNKPKSTKSKLVWSYGSGYLFYEITDANGGFYFEWSASNGFDGGGLKGDINIKGDVDDLYAYCKKSINRISYLQTR